jgi:hypothetical protein
MAETLFKCWCHWYCTLYVPAWHPSCHRPAKHSSSLLISSAWQGHSGKPRPPFYDIRSTRLPDLQEHIPLSHVTMVARDVAICSGFMYRYATYEPKSRFVYPEEIWICTDLPRFGPKLAKFAPGFATRLRIADEKLTYANASAYHVPHMVQPCTLHLCVTLQNTPHPKKQVRLTISGEQGALMMTLVTPKQPLFSNPTLSDSRGILDHHDLF